MRILRNHVDDIRIKGWIAMKRRVSAIKSVFLQQILPIGSAKEMMGTETISLSPKGNLESKFLCLFS